MLHTPLAIAGAVTMFLACGFAIIAGSWRERMGGVVLLIDYVLNFLLGLVIFKLTILRFLVGDVICLIGFLYLCWKAPHPWPLWAFGLQFCSVMTEVAALGLGRSLMKWTFLTIELAAGYGILIVLLIGTFAALRARKRMRSSAKA
ncbi:MAG TPA: hypothetical protein VG839_02820 [Asticcacaulis sp.]|nr:hypothetical protein [Asticcacaulis sp.]